jgi:hypothetical protein
MTELLTVASDRTETIPPFTYDLEEFLGREIAIDLRLIPEYESERAAVLAGHLTGQVYKDPDGTFSVVGPLPRGGF